MLPQLRHRPCTSDGEPSADNLVRQSSFVVHMNAKLPTWFTESTWICKFIFFWSKVCKFFTVKKKTNKCLKSAFLEPWVAVGGCWRDLYNWGSLFLVLLLFYNDRTRGLVLIFLFLFFFHKIIRLFV